MSLFDPRMMDPSKLSPEMMMKMSQLVQELPPSMLSRMQALMHNSMAGFDVSREVAAFEADLPAGFREKMARLMYEMHGVMPSSGPSAATGASSVASAESKPEVIEVEKKIDSPKEARLTVLRAVASGDLAPEQALEVLFPND